ncbi:MAG: hypothetical protein M1838_001660 [Thelocarpon superellum]|nr:MAG: hypothetical protein M1838_001660 [Thelocarpon superellum]
MLLSGEMAGDVPPELGPRAKFQRWMLQKGYHGLYLSSFIAVHTMIFVFSFMSYAMKDNLYNARQVLGVSYPLARGAAMVLNFDAAILLFPVCRTLISLARQTPLNGIIHFDKNLAFHKLVAWSIVTATVVHVISHWNNFARLAARNNLGFKGFLALNFTTGPGWTGYLMLSCLIAIVCTAHRKARQANHERFMYTHHLFIPFFIFWSVHGEFCMIKPDLPPYCANIGLFWKFWAWGALVYLAERILREIRGRYSTVVSKVVQHPSKVVEIQMKKDKITSRAGQYVFICCPEVSIWQYHPFTLTSAPQEDYVSVHIRCVGDFTKALAGVLGCNFEDKSGGSAVTAVNKDTAGVDVDAAIRRIMPKIYVDGPFGSASEDVFKYEVAILVGAGIGVTPFASILKSIWYRMNYPQERTRLRKVYFFWVCRDFGSFEWFRSLLMAIEAQDMDNAIEIHTYLTAKIAIDDATNIMIHDTSAPCDAITGLRAPTNFGRPNWDAIFRSIRKIHSPTEAGVFFCGPKPLGAVLNLKCKTYSNSDVRFAFGSENF